MKLALTVWDDRISPVFDACREARILLVERGSVVAQEKMAFAADSPEARVNRLIDAGIGVLICGAISEPLQNTLLDRGVDVIGFVAGNAEEVMTAYLSGRLPNHGMAMPGCRAQCRRHRRRRRRGCRATNA